jgi:signal transduction histidine kinase
MRRLTLRSKTIIGTALIEGILLLALIYTVTHFVSSLINDALQKRAATTSTLFASMVKDAVLSYDLASIDAFVGEVLKNPDIEYARVISPRGEVFAVGGNDTALGKEFIADANLEGVNDGIFDSFALIQEAEQVYARVEVGFAITSTQASIAKVKQWTVGIAALEMALVALFSLLLGNYLTGQLRHLQTAASKMKDSLATGHFADSRVAIDSNDELSDVALAFNSLVDKIEASTLETAKYQHELELFNQNLEQKVMQRTTELSSKNTQLQKANIDLKQAQQQLVQAEKLASMGQLAAGLAHEVNNPVSFVSSNLGTMHKYMDLYQQVLSSINKISDTEESSVKKQLETELQGFMQEQDMHFVSEDMQALLSDMEEGLQRVTDIVQNMSVFSRVNSEETQMFNINRCIESTFKMVKKQLKEKAEITLELNEVPDVEMNVGKINQVLTNLLINASQSIQSYGKIKVCSKLKDNQITVFVSDTGCGIEKSALDKIFDPFYTTKKEGEGTGLGLAISYDIVQEHGGKLSAASAVGKGTVFTLNLPLKTTVIH